MVDLHNTKHDKILCIDMVETRMPCMSSVTLDSRFFKPNKLKSLPTKKQALHWSHKELLETFNGIILSHSMN